MTKWEYIRNITRAVFSKKKAWSLESGYNVEIAFYSGGKPYYKLTDPFNTYAVRGLQAWQTYDEVLMRTDTKDMQLQIKKLKALVNSQEIRMVEIIRIILNLDERINFSIPPRELIYKLATVTYFDETESPFEYDSNYADKKMADWKHNGDVDDFFLFNQLRNFIPLPELSKEHYQMFQETMAMILSKQRGLPLPSLEKNGAPSSSIPK